MLFSIELEKLINTLPLSFRYIQQVNKLLLGKNLIVNIARKRYLFFDFFKADFNQRIC